MYYNSCFSDLQSTSLKGLLSRPLHGSAMAASQGFLVHHRLYHYHLPISRPCWHATAAWWKGTLPTWTTKLRSRPSLDRTRNPLSFTSIKNMEKMWRSVERPSPKWPKNRGTHLSNVGHPTSSKPEFWWPPAYGRLQFLTKDDLNWIWKAEIISSIPNKMPGIWKRKPFEVFPKSMTWIIYIYYVYIYILCISNPLNKDELEK